MPNTITLGTAVDLTLGFNPSWVPGDSTKSGLFISNNPPLKPLPDRAPQSGAPWSDPIISSHATAEDLLTAIFPFKVVNPNDGIKEAEISAGALLIGDKDRKAAIKSLSQTLGIDLSRPDYSYILVKTERFDNQLVHPTAANGVLLHPHPQQADSSLGVNKKFTNDLISIRNAKDESGNFHPENLSVKQAQICIDLFGKWGTHFISKIILGDRIFQVFAMDTAAFKKVNTSISSNDFSGMNALNFVQFTTSAKSGAFGYVSEYSSILSLSGDTALQNSISAGKWKDDVYAETDSIFTPWLGNSAKVTTQMLNTTFNQSVPVDTELTGLSLFVEFERRKVWKRVFKGVVIQKFKGSVIPHFEHYCPFDDQKLIPKSEIEGFISTIATKEMNTYKPHIELNDLQFAPENQTKSFHLCTNLLTSVAQETVVLPGDQVAIIGQVASMETDIVVDTIQLSDKAFSTYEIRFGRFFGCLYVTDTSGENHETILDGLKYVFNGVDANGRALVKISDDLRLPPDPGILAQLQDNLYFPFAFAEAWLTGANSVNITSNQWGLPEFALDTMFWLGKIITAASTNAEWLDLRLRALDAARSALNPTNGVFVPLLPPDVYAQQIGKILDYSDAIALEIRTIQAKIDNRKLEELVEATGAALNQNIIESGKMLSGFIQASASQQNDLSKYYGAVITQKKSELSLAQTKVDNYQDLLDKQQLEVKNAVTAYKTAVEDKKIRDEIQLAVDIVSTLFTLGAAIAEPATAEGALASLIIKAKQIKKVLAVLEAGYKIYSSVDSTLGKLAAANNSLDDLNEIGFDMNSAASWDEMNVDLGALLDLGADVPEAKTSLKAAFAILVIRGKALINAREMANNLARDTYTQQKLQALSDAQQNRLDKIQTSLQPANLPRLQPENLDLIGMTGSLMFVRSQMLNILAKTFILQDQALQYQNLQSATPINSFDLLNFKGAIVQQGQTTLDALTKLNAVQASTTTPIEVKVQVPAAAMVSGGVFSFPIHPDLSQFIDYMDVRVKGVMVKVTGVEGTDSGDFDFKLSYTGAPFCDRTSDNSIKVFRTPSRERIYAFDVHGNTPKFTDNGNTWSEGVNPITPFSTWQLSFPENTTNKGIRFNSTMLTVTLSFTLVARIVSQRMTNVGARWGIRPKALLAVADGPKQAPPIGDILASMAGKSVVNGWDVVFNMALPKIQKALNTQYDTLKTSTQYGGKINTQSSNKATSHVTIWKKFDLQYGYPKLSFQTNDTQQVLLEIPILSGNITSGSQYDNNPVDWDPPVNVDANASVSAVVPIGKIAGQVSGAATGNSKLLSVVLDLAQGSFLPKNMKIDDDDDKAAFNQALINYFTNNKVVFLINTLDLSKITTIDDLRPNQFVFKALTTQTYKNQILQLFISTSNRNALDYSQAFLNNLDEPIPMGADCSMLISTKVFFNGVLPSVLNQKGWHVAGANPKNAALAWSGLFDGGAVTGKVDLSKMNRSYTPPSYGGGMTYTTYYTYSIAGGSVSVPIAGMTLSPQTSKVKLAFTKQTKQQFNEHSETPLLFGDPMVNDRTLSSDYTLNIALDIPIKIGGQGRQQTISFDVTGRDATITGHLSGGGPCGCGDDIQATFNQQLQAQLPAQINSQMNVTLPDLSVFALKNLLFPDNNYINFSAVNIPGDLIITGEIKD